MYKIILAATFIAATSYAALAREVCHDEQEAAITMVKTVPLAQKMATRWNVPREIITALERRRREYSRLPA